MRNSREVQIPQRLAELDREGKNRLLDSALSPLAIANPTGSAEPVVIPAELLLRRFKDLDMAVIELNRAFQVQAATGRRTARRNLACMIAMVVLTWTATFGLSRLSAPRQAPEHGLYPGRGLEKGTEGILSEGSFKSVGIRGLESSRP